MKKIFSILLVAVVVLSSCKKGENDKMSLKSRKGRLTGEWKLTAYDNKLVSTSTTTTGTSTTTTTYTSDGATYTLTSVSTSGSISVTSTGTGTYTEKITFEKDGTYERVTTMSSTNSIGGATYTSTEDVTETGVWSFVDKNKDEEMSSAERILLQSRSITTVSKDVTKDPDFTDTDEETETETSTGVSAGDIEIMLLDKLSSKEIVVKWDNSDGSTTVSKWSTDYVDNTYINDVTGSSTSSHTSTEVGSATYTQE